MTNAFSFTNRQTSIINGSLLGDGSITAKRKGNCAFVKPQATSRRPYLEWHYKELMPLSIYLKDCPNVANGKTYSKTTFRTSSHPLFTELRERWYPNGVKVVPRDLILDDLSLAVWFFDDGSNDLENRTCRFATYAFSKEDCDYLVAQLESFGLRSDVGARNVIQVRACSYRRLVDLVRPCMLWDCFGHKIAYRDPQKRPLDKSDVQRICDLREQGLTLMAIADDLGISIGPVSDVLRGKHSLSPFPNVELAITNTSGAKNVSWDKRRQKWIASVKIGGKTKHLGRFVVKEEAVQAVEKFRRDTLLV